MKAKSQAFAIGAIVVASLAAGALLIRSKPTPPAHPPPSAQGDQHDHDHDDKGRVRISPEKAKAAGIVLATAGGARVKSTLNLHGRVAPNEETMLQVTARFPGVVKSVRKRLGDAVAKGEVLATIESSASLRTYEVTSEIGGTLTRREVTPGEFVTEQRNLFTVADLSSVWIDFSVYREDAPKLKRGQRVLIHEGTDPAAMVETTFDYLSPLGSEVTQTRLARAVVPNPAGAFATGLFVEGLAVLDESDVALAVEAAALHTLDGRPVVFVEEGDGFEARVVEVGRRDPHWLEIRSGLQAGERYATANSFLLKAEIGKETAAHEH